MDCPGITFTVQWKKKSGAVSRQEDVTSIGLWDIDDSTLDWQTFKSYVCQNLGTADNISVAYVDSDGDELPIESDCEFREALKFARHHARNGRETILKVARQETSDLSSPPVGKVTNTANPEDDKNLQKYILKEDLKNAKMESKPAAEKNETCRQETFRVGLVSNINPDTRYVREKTNAAPKNNSKDADKPKLDQTVSVEVLVEQLQKLNLEHINSPPLWFKRYLQQMKNEIVEEVTANILHEIRQVLPNQKAEYGGPRASSLWSLHKNKKKKKVSDEESSDTLGESRDYKLLKKMEKLHKREKKLEKKLDSKLEKLENKTKRLMEKKSQCKSRCERVPERKANVKRRSGDLHFGTYLMDAIVLNDGPKSEIVISTGECFPKIWEIMNAGTLPWTDKTELRQSWGTYGLVPEKTVVKCPILKPGEKGIVCVKFRAPDFAGTFKSYWHFYHMGERFGHWIGCAVVVKEPNELPELNDLSDSFGESHITTPLAKVTAELKRQCQLNEGQKPAVQHRCITFESDIDSDNLSMISGPGSVLSETEDENFVVIPMPACFVCEVPLGSVETVPVVVKSDLKKNIPSVNTSLEFEREANLHEREEEQNDTEETPNVSETSTANSSERNPSEENSSERSASERNVAECKYKPRKKVYAVDANGCCVAVDYSFDVVASPNDTNSAAGSGEPHSSGAQDHSSAGTVSKDPVSNVIHILPEMLVSGAVNVASSAISTARAVFSNLRSRPPWDEWNNVPMPPTDGTTSDNLQTLLEMGFTNEILNMLLLQQYENDLVKVIAELVSYEDDTSENQQ